MGLRGPGGVGNESAAMSGAVDELAVIDGVLDAELLPDTEARQMSAARTAMGELIEADIEFNAAYMTYQAAKTGKPRNDAWDRVLSAIDRQNDAMRRVVGAA